ncbi:unnamed protein product [Haemonchus placei]|uniref:G_PROTEIN_RECEP_F1_2 domain-containing protein n=1 Tax=Haemonchus placei TaxID=6290 RepID=A0A0N4WII0_HAEPC|nr:unnamed protein product [Haemonchus placei]
MAVFYFNIPWVINQSEYNCSIRSLSEWESRGTANVVQGIYLTVSGSIFMALYILCLIGMFRGKLLRIPCYRLMFFNGIIDNMDILVGSFISAYFDFTGAVFCTSIGLNWFAGHFSWCVWLGSSFNCMVLALNRVVEMTPSASGLGFLFRGKLLSLWMVLSVVFMAILPFVSRTHPFNSVIGTFIISPVITDNATQESSYFAHLFVPSYNVTVVFVLFTLYSFLCFNIIKMRSLVKGGNHKLQIQLFTQALFICTTVAMTALLYSWLMLFPAPPTMAIASHILWQLSHGLHGIMYLCLNRQIRGEVLRMFFMKKQQTIKSVATVQTVDRRRI